VLTTQQALCHCRDCQKITGSTYSTNIVVPGENFKVEGNSKEILKIVDSGNKITSYFCGDCGFTLYRDGPTFGPNKVVKVGVMDDPNALNDAKPAVELYAGERVSWVPEHPGAGQQSAMP
jgi:hypothetical protein